MEASTWVATAWILPRKTACPSVRVFMASSAMLNPFPAWSMAVRKIETPVVWSVSSQQVPQLGEPKPEMALAPPMLGNVGNDPKVGN